MDNTTRPAPGTVLAVNPGESITVMGPVIVDVKDDNGDHVAVVSMAGPYPLHLTGITGHTFVVVG